MDSSVDSSVESSVESSVDFSKFHVSKRAGGGGVYSRLKNS